MRTKWPSNMRQAIVALLLVLNCMAATASAAPPADWEVMAVLIPADLKRQYIPRMYEPIEIEDLEAKLRLEQQRRREKQLRSPGLVEAFYVAKIENSLLVSDQSRWRFRGGPRTASLNLGIQSVAIRDARTLDATRLEQLSDYQSFLSDGSLEVSVAATQADRWLGFAKTSVVAEEGYEFELRLPAATVATMLVSTARNEQLSSGEAVVEQIDDARGYLPADWPPALARQVTFPNNRRWWRINLSGAKACTLRVTKTLEEDAVRYRHSLRQAAIEYLIGTQQLEVQAQWQIASTSSGAALQLRLAEQLRVKSLLVNNVAVQWKSVFSSQPGENWIEIIEQPTLEPGTVIQLAASSELGETTDTGGTSPMELPGVQLAQAWCIQGSRRVRAQAGITINGVECNGIPCKPELINASSDPSSEEVSREDSATSRRITPEDVAWTQNWSGITSPLMVRLSGVQSRWQVESLNQISVQTAWISATSRIILRASQVRSNELRLQVNPEWYIDSIELIGNVDGDRRAELVEHYEGDQRRSEVVISWERERSSVSLQLELELTAHSPKNEASDTLTLERPRLVALPAADQSDYYAIESSGRFRVQPTSELYRFQLPMRELPQWQQALLTANATEAWLFQDRHQALPAIPLRATGGTYSVEMHTLLASEESNASASSTIHRIYCRPLSGNVDRLRVLLPPGFDASQWSFEMLESGEDSSLPLRVEETLGATGEPREVSLVFPSPQSSVASIRAKFQGASNQDSLRIPTLSFPQAVSTTSMLYIPEQSASFADAPALELLPHRACCSADDSWLFDEELPDVAPESYAAARLDGSEPLVVELREQPARQTLGWAWKHSLDQYLWDDGSAEYVVQWDIETSDAMELRFLLPASWKVDRVLIDGVATTAGQLNSEPGEKQIESPPGFSAYRLAVPRHRRTLVSLECSQGAKENRRPILSKRMIELPRLLNLPVFDASYRLHVPPSNLAWTPGNASSVDSPPVVSSSEVLPSKGGNKIADRLWPRFWWDLLTPKGSQAIAGYTRDEAASGWSMVEWSNYSMNDQLELDFDGAQTDERQSTSAATDDAATKPARTGPTVPAVWIINRNALVSFLLASVVTLTTLSWLVLSRWLRAWWLVAAVSMLAAVLVPREWVPWTQLILLALSLAALVQMIVLLTQRRVLQRAASEAKANRRTSLANGTWGHVSLLCCVLASNSANGQSGILTPMPVAPVQSSSSTAQSPTLGSLLPASPASPSSISGTAARATDKESSQLPPPELFGILFPVDEDSNISGAYAYVPKRLWELLSTTDRQATNVELPRVTAVTYFLRLLPGRIELTCDLRIQATQADTELRLPFRADELRLVGGQIDGEDRLVGLPGLRQESQYVALKASKAASFPVKLEFEASSVGLLKQFSAAIPPIPNATLRIEAEGLQVAVNAVGGVQRSVNDEWLAHLGPLERLEISWTESSRPGFSPQVEIASNTWVHANGDRLMAACQLKIPRNARSPQVVHVYIDSDWEPIGTTWGDAELLTSETLSFGNRRVYTVRLPTLPSLAPQTQAATTPSPQGAADDFEETVIRTLLVPSNTATSTSLTVPFMFLQEISKTSTKGTLSWSTGVEPSDWKADGIDFWNEALDLQIDWGTLVLADQKRSYRVPLVETGPLQLRRQPATPTPVTEERTLLRYSQAEVEIDYAARWDTKSFNPAALQLMLPADSRIVELLVNGQPVQYSASAQLEGQSLLIPTASQRIASVNALNIRVSLPTEMGIAQLVPRIVLRGATVGSSRLLVYRAAMLDLKFDDATYGELLRNQISTPASLLLDSLEVLVGEYELGAAYRESPLLPVAAVVTRAQATPPQYAFMRLNPIADGWEARVTAAWKPEAELDFAFFDVPSITRNILQAGSVARKFMPATDPSRATLCIVPTTATNGQRVVQFAFPIQNAASGQAIALPQVRLIAEQPHELMLALPRSIGGKSVTWKKAGNRVPATTQEQIAESEKAGVEFYAPSPTRAQIAWQPAESAALQTKVIQRMVHVVDTGRNRTAAVASYWLLPRGELELEFQLAEGCRVLGVDVAGSSAIWQQPTPPQLLVSVQPNYLPVNVQLLIEWQHADDDRGELELPIPVAEVGTSDWIASMDSNPHWRLRAPRGQSLLEAAGPTATIKPWVELLLETLQSQASSKSNEVSLWLASWEPAQLGLAYDQSIDARILSPGNRDLDEDGTLTIGEFWKSIGGTVPIEASAITKGRSPTEVAFVISQNRLAFASSGLRESLGPRFIAASLLAIAALLSYVVARWLRTTYLQLIENQPWVYWLQFGFVALAFLPSLWPGMLLIAVASILLVTRLISHKSRLPSSVA